MRYSDHRRTRLYYRRKPGRSAGSRSFSCLSFRIREMDHFICYVQWFYEPYFSTLFGSSHLLFFEAENADHPPETDRPGCASPPGNPSQSTAAVPGVLPGTFAVHRWSSNQPFPAAGLGKIYPAGSCYYTYQVYGGSHCRSVSQEVFITPQYLSRLFSRYLGCSVYEYLTKFRLSKAKELLVSNRGSGYRISPRM